MDSGIILWWIFCTIIGGAIGMAKDRVVSGVIWGGLLGPIGIIVVLCLPNLKKQKEEAITKQQLALQIQLQEAQLEQLRQTSRTSPPPPTGYQPTLRIASNGQDLGELPVETVKLMLQSGKLTLQDFYLDTDSNDWMQLDCCTALIK